MFRLLFRWLKNSFWYMVIGSVFNLILVILMTLEAPVWAYLVYIVVTPLVLYPVISAIRSRVRF